MKFLLCFRTRIACLFGVLLFCQLELLAEREFPRIHGEQSYLSFFSRHKEALDWKDLFNISLSASGVKKVDLERYQRIVSKYIMDLKEEGSRIKHPYAKGELILAYMFRHLNRYEAFETRMDVLLDDGVYNCVSSAIMYVVLARALNLKATGVGTYEHAFVNLEIHDGQHIDVETTNRFGFDPGNKKEFVNLFTAETGFVYVPKKNYAKRNDMKDKDFVGLILQNRLYILHQQGLSEAVLEQMIPLAADLASLTQNAADIKNFFEMVVDFSQRLSLRGAVDESLEFLNEVLAMYGKVPRVLGQRDLVAYNHVVLTVQAKSVQSLPKSNVGATRNVDQKREKVRGKIKQSSERPNLARAKSLLEIYQKQGYLTAKHSKKLSRQLTMNELVHLLEDPSISFFQKLKQLRAVAKDLPLDKRTEVYHVLFNNEITRRNRQNDFLGAVEVLRLYPASFRASQRYKTLLRQAEGNYAISVYNDTVRFIHEKDYKGALKVVQRGLSVLPQNLRLLRLKASVAKLL